MATVKENDNPVFDYRSLRLAVGALAFGLPGLVYILAGRITTSISASYHELATRDIFVGSLFVIGILLIAYKGHLQGEPRAEGVGAWEWFRSFKWIHRYQEDLISTIGGAAAITAALFPTACDTCDLDRAAYIHMVSAFILFANVVYFCIIAFLRSLNKKLLDYQVFKEDAVLMQKVNTIRTTKTGPTLNPLRLFWNLVTLEVQIFLALASEQLGRYKRDRASLRFARLWSVYGKKFARGFVYVLFGSLTLLVLLVFLMLVLLVALKAIPDILKDTHTTFVIEALALWFFGVTWMTASQMEYWRQIQKFLERFRQKQPAVAEPGLS
jgi:hypothetical protein